MLKLQAPLPTVDTIFTTSVTRTPAETISFAFLPGYILSGDGYRITVAGTPTSGDVLKITYWDDRLAGGSETISYTVTNTDTLNSIASNFLTLMQNNAALITVHTAPDPSTLSGGSFVLTTNYLSSNVEPVVGLTSSIASKGSETVTATENGDFTVSGTVTSGDKVAMTISNTKLPAGQETVSYTVAGGDTATSIATGLKNAVNADTALQSISLTAISSGPTITVLAYTNYTTSLSGGATETLTVGTQNRGSTALTVGGVPTTGDILTVTALNGLLPGGQRAISYTVLATDTLASISAAIATAVNVDTTLQNAGIKVDNSGKFAWSQNYTTDQLLPVGASTTSVSATDGNGNSKTNGYASSVNGGSSSTLTYDLNGNMTSDGTNTYAWDADNRMIKITYPGSGNYTNLAYNGLGRNVKIEEYASSSLTDTKQFVWNRDDRVEERDSLGGLIRQFFAGGQKNFVPATVTYFYDKDHLDSVREMTDSSGNIQAQYSFDPFGRVENILEAVPSGFGYAGYYVHGSRRLCLALNRLYDSAFGRWLNRDPIGETGGSNLFCYARNAPVLWSDPSGLDIYLRKGNNSMPGLTLINNLFHESICVDIRDKCCKINSQQLCVSFYNTGFQLQPPSNRWLGSNSINLGGPLQGTVLPETTILPTSYVLKQKRTTCKEDFDFAWKLVRLQGGTDTYSVFRHNCIGFAEMIFDSAPGSLY